MLQLLCASDSHPWTDRWLFLQLPRSVGATWFLFAMSNLLSTSRSFASGIWFLTSLHSGQWYSLGFSVPSSLLQPLHFSSCDHHLSYNIFCTHPPCTTSFLVTFRCSSVRASLVFLRSVAWIGSSQPPSCNSSHSCIAIHFFQKTIIVCFKSIFSRHADRPPLCPVPPVPQTSRCATAVT